MTLHAQTEWTIRVAHAAYPHGNTLMKMRDALGTLYQDQSFAALFPHNGRSVEAPWRLALITVLQFMEELPDRQAADAVRGRIDWKYLIGLELADPGFDESRLGECARAEGRKEAQSTFFLRLCSRFVRSADGGSARERQRTDSSAGSWPKSEPSTGSCVWKKPSVLFSGILAVVAPEWLLEYSDAEWVERDAHRIEESRLPQSESERHTLAEVIGADGRTILTAVFDPLAPPFFREIPALQVMRRIRVQNYWVENGQIRWREVADIPPATRFINPPYDAEARLGRKRSVLWTGYKVHTPEICEQTLPHLITHVATTPAPRTDEAMTEHIQEELSRADLLPGVHFVDAGYVSARVLVNSHERFGIEGIGPVSVGTQWQARATSGIDASQFLCD